MDITKIDKNFKAAKITDFSSNVYTVPCEPFTLYGGRYESGYGFYKIPKRIASEISDGVLWGSRCGAGMRLTFSTDSDSIKLTATVWEKCLMNHMPFVGSASFTLCEERKGKYYFVSNFIPTLGGGTEKFTAQGNLRGGTMKNYILFFPLYSGVTDLQIELTKGSSVRAFHPYGEKKPILYYGSSITQGGCTARADNSYQAYVSEWTNTDYEVLGFSGNAMGEKEIAEYVKEVECSIFVCDYDHNAPTAEHLRNTHLNLYKTFRSGRNHKETPIVFLSKPDGRNYVDEEERVEIIKDTCAYAREHGDKNVYFIDGRKIYPSRIREHCAVDGCHPTDLGFYCMAKKLYSVIKSFEK